MKASRRLAWGACAALLALAPGCRWGGVGSAAQRWPPPMRDARSPLPPGDLALHPPGPEEVSVLRHADPVRIRPAGAPSAYPLAFYDKLARLRAGGAVVVAEGGRAEVLWAGGSSIVLFGNAIGWVGSPGRGEPLFELQDVDLATIQLVAPEQVRLPGGALLGGSSGPYRVERLREDLLAVRNDSYGSLRVAFRELRLDLAPGQAVRLPVLGASGGRPIDSPAGVQRYPGAAFDVEVLGPVEPRPEAGGMGFRAAGDELGERELRALGVRVRLREGEEVRFLGLERSAPQLPPEPPAPPPGGAQPAQPPPADAGAGLGR